MFQVLSELHERGSLIVTTNLPFGEWTKVFPDARMAKAVVDRLTHRAHIIDTGTESWRFRHGLNRRRHLTGRPDRRARGYRHCARLRLAPRRQPRQPTPIRHHPQQHQPATGGPSQAITLVPSEAIALNRWVRLSLYEDRQSRPAWAGGCSR